VFSYTCAVIQVCSHTGVLSCSHTGCAVIQVCSNRGCAVIQCVCSHTGVFSYSVCSYTGVFSYMCAVIKDVFSYSCALIQCVLSYRCVLRALFTCRGVKYSVEQNCHKKCHAGCVPVHGRQIMTSPLSSVQLDRFLPHIDHIMDS